MPITGECHVTLQEFIDKNLHFNFSRQAVESMARAALAKNENYRHIVGGVGGDVLYIVGKASIEDYFIEVDAEAAQKEAAAAEADLKRKLDAARKKKSRLEKKKAEREVTKK